MGKKIVLIAALLLLGVTTLSAETEKPTKHTGTAIGFGGGAGIMNAFAVKDSEVSWSPGVSYTGGIIYEKMFTPTIGIHSGVWFIAGYVNFSVAADGTGFGTSDAWTDIIFLEVPVDAVFSFGSGFFRFSILTGLSFTQLIHSEIVVNDAALDPNHYDFTLSMNYFQVALDFGFRFTFRVGRFTDIFIGIKGQLMVLPTMKEDTGDEDNFIYNAQATTGVMFRMSLL